MGKRNPFPLVGQIHQTGPTREAYTQPVPASLSTAAAKWARRGGVAHWLVTASMWARLSGCFFPQIPLLTCVSSATGFPSLSRRPVTLITCRRCCRAASPMHGTSGCLVSPYVVELFPPLPIPTATPLSQTVPRDEPLDDKLCVARHRWSQLSRVMHVPPSCRAICSCTRRAPTYPPLGARVLPRGHLCATFRSISVRTAASRHSCAASR
jgi:hypothetical protein